MTILVTLELLPVSGKSAGSSDTRQTLYHSSTIVEENNRKKCNQDSKK